MSINQVSEAADSIIRKQCKELIKIGKEKLDQDLLEDALTYFMKAREIKKNYLDNHISNKSLMKHLAFCYFQMHNYDEAYKYSKIYTKIHKFIQITNNYDN